MMTDGSPRFTRPAHHRRQKATEPGKAVYTFALGSRDLYATLDRNRDMDCCPR
jgi:hypothetical protein